MYLSNFSKLNFFRFLRAQIYLLWLITAFIKTIYEVKVVCYVITSLLSIFRARVFCLVQENTDKDFPWGRDKPFWPCARARLKKGSYHSKGVIMML